ncbi:LysR family transcriptional regulator [Rhodobacteraceae bacterium M382]|nr:LysR family transcriptional regulator [Rhodobacteraceae bacterium M382]
MNFQQLTVFREVMKTGSVSDAARNLHRTQPAISASLKALEASLGIELFQRDGRRLLPVPEAYYLLSEASEILDRLKSAESNLSGLRDRTSGVLRIVAMPGPSAHILPRFVSSFIDSTPDVQVTFATRSSPQIRSLIAAQSFDLGFCDTSNTLDQDLLCDSENLFCKCLCALHMDHPLAKRDVIQAEDLDGVPMGVLQPNHGTYLETTRAFAERDAQFNIRIDAQYFIPLFHFIEAGQICSIVDVLSAESYLSSRGDQSRIRFVPFEPVVPFGYSILTPYNKPMSRLSGAFVVALRDRVENIIKTRQSGS